jgi:DNA mismatch repair protein MutS2
VRAEREKLEHKRDKLEARFEKERAKVLKDIQTQAQTIVRQWQADKLGRKETRRKLAEVRERVLEMGPDPTANAGSKAGDSEFVFADIVPGMKVSYPAWNKSGTVIEVNGRKRQVKVDIGGVAMWIKAENLGPVEKPQQPMGRVEVSPPAPPSELVVEVDIRGNRADMALSMLERAMDDALRKGAGKLEIIHGRGTGALRREVHDFLGHYPAVAEFSIASEERGGDGMTEVTLK